MFLTEQELKDTFWKNYNYSGRAIRYQFESSIREGNADLVTVEMTLSDDTRQFIKEYEAEEGGKWTMIHRPFYRNKVELNQEILKLMLLKF